MRGYWKLAVAALLGAAIAIPATVIARGGASVSGDADRFAIEATANVQTQGKGWKPVGITLPTTGDAISATVTATMTEGQAKFRLVSPGGNAQPSSALFTAEGANSFAFAATQSCPALELEWKRKGDTPASAAAVSVLAVYQDGACV